jgi:hypothetical protein
MIDLENSVNNLSPKNLSPAELDTCIEKLSKRLYIQLRQLLELTDRET